MVLCVVGLFANNPLVAQGPENTIVVVNEESPDSLAVANLYISLRDIPTTNVVYLRDVPHAVTSFESCDYRRVGSKILEPVLKTVRERGVEQQIDCIAYSSGFPTRVNIRPQLDIYRKQTGKAPLKKPGPHWASLTSLTYFYFDAMSSSPRFMELDANHYANPRRMKIQANPFSEEDATQYDTALQRIELGSYEKANRILDKLAKEHPNQMSVVFALARCLAFQNKSSKALNTLQHAKRLGFANRSLITNDKAFSSLMDDESLTKLLDQIEDLPDGIPASRSFSNHSFWGPNGWRSGSEEQGDRYILASVLAVTGKGQSTLDASLSRLESSIKADGTAPAGNVYFAKHADPRSKTRHRQFDFAVEELKSLDRPASIGSDIYPLSDDRVIGVSIGSPKPNWLKSKSTFLPGAICDNFTSYGGLWAKTFQTHVNEFLDAGAAGACGFVTEPYTIAAKVPTARWHAHYARGLTLAESFYQSVSSPFQLLLVGDPLCCPFGEFPEFELTGLKQDAVVKSDFTLHMKPASDSPKIRHYEVFFDGVFIYKVKDAKKMKIAIEAISDGYHELRLVAVGDSIAANRNTRTLEFVANRKGHRISLKAAKENLSIDQELKLVALSSSGAKIQVLQNSRVIATVDSGKAISIPAAKLGLGKTQLHTVTKFPDGSMVKSTPIDITVGK